MGKKEGHLIALPAKTLMKNRDVHANTKEVLKRELSNKLDNRLKSSWNGDINTQNGIVAAIRNSIESINHQLQQQPSPNSAQQTPEQQNSSPHGPLPTGPPGLQPPHPFGPQPVPSMNQQPSSSAAQQSPPPQPATFSSSAQSTPSIQPPTFILPEPNQSRTEPTTSQHLTPSSEMKSLQTPTQLNNSNQPGKQTLIDAVSQTAPSSQAQSMPSTGTSSAVGPTQNSLPPSSSIQAFTATEGMMSVPSNNPRHDLGGLGEIGVFKSGTGNLNDDHVGPLILLLLVIFSTFFFNRR